MAGSKEWASEVLNALYKLVGIPGDYSETRLCTRDSGNGLPHPTVGSSSKASYIGVIDKLYCGREKRI